MVLDHSFCRAKGSDQLALFTVAASFMESNKVYHLLNLLVRSYLQIRCLFGRGALAPIDRNGAAAAVGKDL